MRRRSRQLDCPTTRYLRPTSRARTRVCCRSSLRTASFFFGREQLVEDVAARVEERQAFSPSSGLQEAGSRRSSGRASCLRCSAPQTVSCARPSSLRARTRSRSSTMRARRRSSSSTSSRRCSPSAATRRSAPRSSTRCSTAPRTGGPGRRRSARRLLRPLRDVPAPRRRARGASRRWSARWPRKSFGARSSGPAEQAGLVLEPGMVEAILRDVAGQPGALPLLSHSLLETWKRRSGRMLTRDRLPAVRRRTGGDREDGRDGVPRHAFRRAAGACAQRLPASDGARRGHRGHAAPRASIVGADPARPSRKGKCATFCERLPTPGS